MAIRDVAWDYLRSLVDKGFGLDAIQKTLQGVGLGYRREVMSADINVLLGKGISERAIKSFPKYFVPDEAYTVPTPKDLKHKYLYEFNVTGKSLVSGEPEDRTYSLYTDDPMPIGKAEEEIRDRAEREGSNANYEVYTVTLAIPWRRESK